MLYQFEQTDHANTVTYGEHLFFFSPKALGNIVFVSLTSGGAGDGVAKVSLEGAA